MGTVEPRLLAEPTQVIRDSQSAKPGDIQVKLFGGTILTRLIVQPVETWDRWDSIEIQVKPEIQLLWYAYLTDKTQPVFLRFTST